MLLELKQLRLNLGPTFKVVAPSVAGANNKAMVGVMNTGTHVARVWQVWVKNVNTVAATGILGLFECKRITSVTGQTSLTPMSLDLADTLPAGVTAFTAGTPVEVAGVLAQHRWSTDEMVVGTADQDTADHGLQETFPAFTFGAAGKPLVLRNGQGFAVMLRAASAPGTWDLEVEFTTAAT